MRTKRYLYMRGYQSMSKSLRWMFWWWYQHRAKPSVLDRAELLLTPASFDADAGIWFDQSGNDRHATVRSDGSLELS